MNYQFKIGVFLLASILLSTPLFPQEVRFEINKQTGAIRKMTIKNDTKDMNWLLSTDGSQYSWVTEKYGWGLGYFTETVDGRSYNREWITPTSIGREGKDVVYRVGNIRIEITRSLSNKDIVEEYTLTNQGEKTVYLSDIGVYTPFNDNYPDAKTCMEARTHAHIWDGGSAAYVNATQMGANSPHVGLLLTNGAIKSYEIWERGVNKHNSQTRGVISLNIPDTMLAPGEKTSFTWQIFSHKGWNDFFNQIQQRNNIVAKCNRYTFQRGETARLEIVGNEELLKNCMVTHNDISLEVKKEQGKRVVEMRMDKQGEVRFDISYGEGRKTHVACLVFDDFDKLIDARVNFIKDYQQMNDKNDLRDGAYMVYDNETDQIYKNDTPNANPPDRDEGAERLSMGLLMAEHYEQTKDPALKESLMRYARFVRNRLQTKDYVTYSSVDQEGRNRGYNYAWVASLYFKMSQITGEKQYAIDGYQTMQALYSQFGHGFYCINIPVLLGLEALKEFALSKEYKQLKADYIKTGNIFIENGLNYPKHEVNYEQSIVAPAITFLTQLYLETKNKKYLDEIKRQLPVLESFGGFQPSFHMNEIAIRHWDGYWFGKREFWGDNYPHYWSTLTAVAYHYYAKCSGDISYQLRAQNIVRNNLCLFTDEGRASCAYIYPYRVNGKKAAFYDPFANDQDWALVYYKLINE